MTVDGWLACIHPSIRAQCATPLSLFMKKNKPPRSSFLLLNNLLDLLKWLPEVSQYVQRRRCRFIDLVEKKLSPNQ